MTEFKIVIIVDNFFPHIGGVEKMFLDLAKGLLKQGMDVRVITSNSGGITGYHKFEGVDVYSYKWFSFADHSIPSLKDLREHVQWADVIHTCTNTAGPMACRAGKIYNKPVLITVPEFVGKNWSWIEPNQILRLGYQLVEWYAVSRNYDYVVAISKFTERNLIKTHIAEEKIQTVYCAVDGIDLVEKDRQALCTFAGTEAESTIFLYYGRPGQPKGVFVYLDAIKLAAPRLTGKKVKFVFILSKEPNKERSRFLQQVQEAGLNSLVAVRDPQPRKKLLQYVKSSDFIVVPSITEGFGLTAVESCQLGKKVIHSDGGSLPEVVSGQTLSFANRDSKDLADKLEYALNGGEFKQTLLKSFSAESMVQGYLDAYRKITTA